MARNPRSWPVRLSRMVAASVVAAACTTFAVHAQMPTDPNAPQMYPQYPQYPDPNAAPPQKGAFKRMFAGTLAAVLSTTGAGIATSLATAMSGAITNWFNKPPKTPPPMTADAMGGMGGMSPGAMGSGMPGAMPTMPAPSADPMGGMPQSSGMPMGDMSASSAAMGMPGAAPAPGMPAMTTGFVAGLAYEVQLQRPDGQVMSVDPATYVFMTGDRFVVMYRPSLPGQVSIYNVNPLGQEKLIDSVNVAAGELTRLGPYEFRANTGTEVLRLSLSPCRNDAMLAMTRDIVKVEDMPGTMPSSGSPAPQPPALALQECSAVASRSVRPQSRDIVKVGAEDGTMFALDPVSQQEMSSGTYAPRELTLTFNHR